MIIFDNVWFKYSDGDYVLKNINTTIKEGEIVCILGDNGAGKTTLLKHINGLLKPTKGEVYVDELNTKEASVSDLAKKVALVFQYPERMFFTESVWKEVEFALANFGFEEDIRAHRIRKVLNMFWLWEYKDSSPFTLSGGEQRRLAIAIVLAWDPRYVVLDEPTAGQDGFQREILIDMIRNIVHREKTIILATHDIEFVFELPECRIITLNKGEIIYDGSSVELFNNYPELLIEAGLEPPSLSKLIQTLRMQGKHVVFKNYDDAVDKIYNLIKRGEYNK